MTTAPKPDAITLFRECIESILAGELQHRHNLIYRPKVIIELCYHQRVALTGQPIPTFEARVLEVFYAHNKDKFVMSLVGEFKVLTFLNCEADKAVKGLYRKLESRHWELEYRNVEDYLERVLWVLETNPVPV